VYLGLVTVGTVFRYEERNTQMVQRWLKCTVQKGMFSDERAVSYPPTGACASSVFVPEKEVEGDVGQQGRVRVQYFQQGKSAWAVLPAEDQPIIRVRQTDLAEL
jgi:hypothetical protein